MYTKDLEDNAPVSFLRHSSGTECNHLYPWGIHSCSLRLGAYHKGADTPPPPPTLPTHYLHRTQVVLATTTIPFKTTWYRVYNPLTSGFIGFLRQGPQLP